MNAGLAVRYARRRAGLTQRALGQRAGVAQPAIARIERGSVNPRLETVVQLLDAAGFSIEVWPRLGDGVDRTLIRAGLERSPEARIQLAAKAARNVRAFQEAVAERPSHLRS